MHAAMRDAALAMTMVEPGFDSEAGALRDPPAADAAAVTGCGSVRCS
ncbi:MAG: hypothetical protein KIT17_03325 [Rubrivivax sp.]|nr:hypothetical protein [Rubrivivax sp.]